MWQRDPLLPHARASSGVHFLTEGAVNDVLTKADCYRRIITGEFGNTLPRYFDVHDWWDYDDWRKYELWGVQHTSIPGFPGTRLDVPRDEVIPMLPQFNGHYCISPMVHQVGTVLWEGDVTEDGAYGHALPAKGSWRQHMKYPDVWTGSARTVLLRSVLNENSYEDLLILLDKYPDHAVELSALSTCFGTVPHRNAVIWEVRKY